MSSSASPIGLTLPSADRRTALRIVGEALREPMFALLLGAGAVYLVLDDDFGSISVAGAGRGLVLQVRRR